MCNNSSVSPKFGDKEHTLYFFVLKNVFPPQDHLLFRYSLPNLFAFTCIRCDFKIDDLLT
jgi:hypothetical protein